MSPAIDVEEVYRPGRVLAEKYKVERTLGVGGFGIVVAATHLQLEEKVAIKILLPEAARNPAAAERFLREAKAAVRIRSEHVARVTDVGTFPAEGPGSPTPYMVMEYLEGCDLSTVVKTRGPQMVGDVCEWVMQACEAIAEAHGLGIIHRDLKPANLFLTHRVDGAPCVKVLDFGISKVASNEADKGMTKSSDVMGSPYYMSPEQMRSTRAVDARSDIWALGAILFELLAGQPPFDGETMTALIVAIMQEQPRDLLSRRRDLPPGLLELVHKCLAKDPAGRYPDVSVLAEALGPYAPARAQAGLSRISASLSSRSRGAGAAGLGTQPTVPGEPGSISHGSSGSFSSGGPGAVSGYPVSPIRNSQPVFSDSAPQTVLPSTPYPHAPGGQTPYPVPAVGYGPPQVTPGGSVPAMAPAATAMGMGPPTLVSPTPAGNWGGTYATQRPSRAPLAIGLVGIVLAAVGASGFILYKNQSTQKPPAPATTIIEVVQAAPQTTSPPIVQPAASTVAAVTTSTATPSAHPTSDPASKPGKPPVTHNQQPQPQPPQPQPQPPQPQPQPPQIVIPPVNKPPAGPFDRPN